MPISCCMSGCENVSSTFETKRRMFFVFPKDLNLCMLWVQSSGKPEYFEDFAFAGAQPFLNRHICSDHFNDNDFLKKDLMLGLLPGSIPTLNYLFQRVDVKEEIVDTEYSECDFLNAIKLEKDENQTCCEKDPLFSSTNDSYNDSSDSWLPTSGTINVYKDTELSNEFFKKYKTAIRSGHSMRYVKKSNETQEERAQRLKRKAFETKIRRSQQSEEEEKLRRMKNALYAALRRQNETPEQREVRKTKDKLRSQRRRKAETESETRLRRYNDAVRAVFRRNKETEEQKMERKVKDIVRAAKRLRMETREQRAERLRRDRERASKRRVMKKITAQMTRLHGVPDVEPGKCEDGSPSFTNGFVTCQSNECSNIEQLQQVLESIESNSKSNKPKRTRSCLDKEENVMGIV